MTEDLTTHSKKQLNITIERPVLNRMLDLLDELKVTGYTVIPSLGGSGSEGTWRRSGMVTDAGQMVVVVCVLDESRVADVLGPVFRLVEKQIGIVTVSDVQVVRPERF